MCCCSKYYIIYKFPNFKNINELRTLKLDGAKKRKSWKKNGEVRAPKVKIGVGVDLGWARKEEDQFYFFNF